MPVTGEARLRVIDEDLWVVDATQRYLGLFVGARMTVLRSGGALSLISPVQMSAELLTELAELGTVRNIVAPNNFHYLYAMACKARFPQAVLWGAPGLAAKGKGLRVDRRLPARGSVGEDMEMRRIDGLHTLTATGARPLGEHVFLHPPTRSLIVTDLITHFSTRSSPLTRLAAALLGGRQPGLTWLEKWASSDKAELWESLEPVLAWDFKRIIMAHGDILEEDARKKLEIFFRRFCRLG